MMALSHGEANQSYEELDFAFYLGPSGYLYIYENSVPVYFAGFYATGDTLRIAVESGVVKYRKNGAVIYTSTATPTYPLLADASLYTAGSTINNVVLSGNLGSSASTVQWLVADHLGTPRMILDEWGNLAAIKRHDYLPFGEELFAPTGGRTAAQGYSGGDGVRQQFTQKERDVETGLDYFLARYYSSIQGRFSSPDPLSSSGRITEPQSWNRYNYCSNNPLNIVDPSGLDWWYLKDSDNPSPQWFDHDPGTDYERWTNTYDYTYYDSAAKKYAVLDPAHKRYFIADTLEQANKLFDTYFASAAGVGSQAEGEFLAGLSSGANPAGILADKINEAIGMDTTSRDYITGKVFGAGLGGGFAIFGSVVFKGAGAGITQLNKQVASESQVAQVAAGEGEAIAGAGSSKVLRDAPRLAAEHGGVASDWAKVRSWSYKAADGSTYEVHAYQHIPSGTVVEYKTKIQ
jgi:RHS repeat-associated protein